MLLEWSGGRASSLHFGQLHELGNHSLTANQLKELIGNAAGNHSKELIGNAVIKDLLLGFSN